VAASGEGSLEVQDYALSLGHLGRHYAAALVPNGCRTALFSSEAAVTYFLGKALGCR
jgi:hypothetical protein